VATVRLAGCSFPQVEQLRTSLSLLGRRAGSSQFRRCLQQSGIGRYAGELDETIHITLKGVGALGHGGCDSSFRRFQRRSKDISLWTSEHSRMANAQDGSIRPIFPQDRVHVEIRHAAPKLQVWVRDHQERPRGLSRPHGLFSRPRRLLQVLDGRRNDCHPQTSIATPLRRRSSVTSLAHRAPATSHHNVRKSHSIDGRPSSEPLVKPCRGPSSREGTVSSGSSRISRGDGHVSGTRVSALRQNGQSWTCRRAPAIEGHYSNAGWLSSGMRLKYRPFYGNFRSEKCPSGHRGARG
jgi:hypothetical protein